MAAVGELIPATPAGGRGNAMLVTVRGRWSALPFAQRKLLLLCLAALVALSAVSFWWSARTDWRTLFSGLDGRDAAQMQQQLTAAGIQFQTTPDGTALQVPAEQIDKARVAIAASGLPQSGRLGFELFDKPNWVGSEFDEKVNYQRALEGELEHTIGSMDAVRSARVHIVLPRQGAFASEDQPAKASAVLKLRRTNLPHDQSESIRNLIAGSVEGLKPEAVTLVDADGRTDLSPGNASGQDRENETALGNKVIAVLEPLAGAGNVHATVSVSYIENSEERTDEVYDPQSATPVATQRTEQVSQATKTGGVAGASSNAPVAQPTVNNAAPNTAPATVAPAGATSNGQTQSSKEESSSFAVTRHVIHTSEAPGRVRRLTAAIVVNDRELQTGTGKTVHTVWQHRSPDEMKRLQQLAQAAVGFDEKRGDQVVLENVAFQGNTDNAAPATLERVSEQAANLLRSQPTLPRVIASGIGLLILGMLVLRPLTRQTQLLLAAPAASTDAAPVDVAEAVALPGNTSPPAIATPLQAVTTGAPLSTQHIFDRVTEQIKTEPANGRRVIGSWIGAAAAAAEEAN